MHTGADQHSSVVYHGTWLLHYLGTLGQGRGDIVKRMLSDIRRTGLTRPQDVYDWVLTAAGQSAHTFEHGFRTYHLVNERECGQVD